MKTTLGRYSALDVLSEHATVRAVSLDAADTLFSSRRLWTIVENHATEVGVEPSAWAAAIDHAGRCGMWPSDSADHAARQKKWEAFFTVGLSAVTPASSGALATAAAQAMTDPATYELFPDTLDCLQRLRQLQIPIALISNFDMLLYDILDMLDIKQLVDAVITSVEVGRTKPASELFREAARRLDADPHHVVHVGDSILCDVGGATTAGMMPVLLDRRGRLASTALTIRTLDEL